MQHRGHVGSGRVQATSHHQGFQREYHESVIGCYYTVGGNNIDLQQQQSLRRGSPISSLYADENVSIRANLVIPGHVQSTT